jgi:hypothetical protein
MKHLQPPNSHHLQAAIGWLELGNHKEANEELEKVAPWIACSSLRSPSSLGHLHSGQEVGPVRGHCRRHHQT